MVPVVSKISTMNNEATAVMNGRISSLPNIWKSVNTANMSEKSGELIRVSICSTGSAPDYDMIPA